MQQRRLDLHVLRAAHEVADSATAASARHQAPYRLLVGNGPQGFHEQAQLVGPQRQLAGGAAVQDPHHTHDVADIPVPEGGVVRGTSGRVRDADLDGAGAILDYAERFGIARVPPHDPSPYRGDRLQT